MLELRDGEYARGKEIVVFYMWQMQANHVWSNSFTSGIQSVLWHYYDYVYDYCLG